MLRRKPGLSLLAWITDNIHELLNSLPGLYRFVLCTYFFPFLLSPVLRLLCCLCTQLLWQHIAGQEHCAAFPQWPCALFRRQEVKVQCPCTTKVLLRLLLVLLCRGWGYGSAALGRASQLVSSSPSGCLDQKITFLVGLEIVGSLLWCAWGLASVSWRGRGAGNAQPVAGTGQSLHQFQPVLETPWSFFYKEPCNNTNQK